MVQDKHNQVFNDLITYLKTVYPDIKGGTTFSDSPTHFPYLYFFLVDAPTALTTLSQTEDGVSTSYQIEAYSDKGTNQCRKIANTVRQYMIDNGFQCRRFKAIQRASDISRFVMIFDRLDV